MPLKHKNAHCKYFKCVFSFAYSALAFDLSDQKRLNVSLLMLVGLVYLLLVYFPPFSIVGDVTTETTWQSGQEESCS